MPSKNVDSFSIDPPHVTVDNLRDYLSSDNLFEDYFNAFLTLPIFPVEYHYYTNKGLFKVSIDSDADPLIPNKAHSQRSKRPSSISARRHSFQPIPLLPMEDNLKYHHERKIEKQNSTLILNKRKGLQWIQNERLSRFLQSRLYAEYRLAKILSQARLIRHDKTSVPDLYLRFVSLEAPPQTISSPVWEDISGTPSENVTDSVYISFGDTSQSDIESFHCNVQAKTSKGSDSDLADMAESSNYEDPTAFSSPSISTLPGSESGSCVMLENMDSIMPKVGPAVYVGPYSKLAEAPKVQISPPKKIRKDLHVNNLQELSLILIAAVVKSAIVEVEGVSEEEVEASLTFQKLFPFFRKSSIPITTDVFKKSVVFDRPVDRTANEIILTDLVGYAEVDSADSSTIFSHTEEKKKKQVSHKINTEEKKKPEFSFKINTEEKKKPEFSFTITDDEKVLHLDNDSIDSDGQICGWFSTSTNIREFQSLIKETSSEKNWFLWIDLEKFRMSKTDAGKETCILSIKNKYYNTTPHFELAVDLKNEIDITNWKSLTDEKVVGMQRKILEPFLQYWVPLYLLKKQIQADPSKYSSYFTLKKLRQTSTKCRQPELDRDVSIFVLKPSPTEKKMKVPVAPKKVGPFDAVPLPPSEPKVGMRRTYLISTLQHESIAKHYNWRKVQQKRNSLPTMKTTPVEKTSSFIFRSEIQDFITPFRSARPSMVSASPESIWPNSPVKIEVVDKKSEAGRKPLPKELSCTKILKSNNGFHIDQPASSKDQDSEEESQKKERYKLLSSLFNALRSERASGDIFAVYLRERKVKLKKEIDSIAWSITGLSEAHRKEENTYQLDKSTNCLMLWDAISKFLCLFYNQPLAWSNVIRQVKLIYSEYLSVSARLNVHCNPEIALEIQQNLNQPTGDMFKYVAEHVLAVLLPSWKQFIIEERCKCVDVLNA